MIGMNRRNQWFGMALATACLAALASAPAGADPMERQAATNPSLAAATTAGGYADFFEAGNKEKRAARKQKRKEKRAQRRAERQSSGQAQPPAATPPAPPPAQH
jgi:hypothetical protein